MSANVTAGATTLLAWRNATLAAPTCARAPGVRRARSTSCCSRSRRDSAPSASGATWERSSCAMGASSRPATTGPPWLSPLQRRGARLPPLRGIRALPLRHRLRRLHLRARRAERVAAGCAPRLHLGRRRVLHHPAPLLRLSQGAAPGGHRERALPERVVAGPRPCVRPTRRCSSGSPSEECASRSLRSTPGCSICAERSERCVRRDSSSRWRSA